MKHSFTRILPGGILYIPSVRSISAQWGAILFLTGLFIVCCLMHFWIALPFLLLLAFFLFKRMPALEIHPNKKWYRRSGNYNVFRGRWKKLPEGRYLNLFAMNFSYAYEARSGEEEIAFDPDTDIQTDRNNLEIYLFIVCEDRRRFPLAHYSGKKTALREARIVARFLGLDLWNATLPEPAWDEDPAKQPRQ